MLFSLPISWSKSWGMSLQSCWVTVMLDISLLAFLKLGIESNPIFIHYGTLVGLSKLLSRRASKLKEVKE